jgi:hypothetical protein
MKISILEESDKGKAAQLEWPNGATISEVSLKYMQENYARWGKGK